MAAGLRDLLTHLYPRLPFHLLVLNRHPDGDRPWHLDGVTNMHLRQPDPWVWLGDDAAWDSALRRLGVGGPPAL
jgi:hypothetical protein